MSEPRNNPLRRRSMQEIVSTKQHRRLAARRQSQRTIWFGLGMFGLIGWSVSIPTLLGVAAGLWIDHRWPSAYSWTLMLMLCGVGLGCINAWRWVHRESEPEPLIPREFNEPIDPTAPAVTRRQESG